MKKLAIKNQYSLFNLFIQHCREYIFSLVLPKRPLPAFPKKVGDYYFVNTLKKSGPRKSYQLAIYKNSKGEKAIAKMRNTYIKGYHYISLLNEIIIYETLTNAMKRLKKRMPEKFKNISIPTLITWEEKDNHLLALLTFVNGKTAVFLSDKQKAKLYFTLIDFLHYLGDNLTIPETNTISKRYPWNMIALYPFLIMKALITYPSQAKEIIRSIPVFIKGIPVLVKNKEFKLVHRDLHFFNVLISGKNISLIDLQQCVFTQPIHEVITTLRYFWHEGSFYKLLLKELIKRNKKSKNFSTLFSTLCINSVTHGLSGSGFSKKEILKWVNFLQFGIHPNFTIYEE